MYKCEECKEKFARPDEKGVDAGFIRDTGVRGKYKAVFVNMCPHCLSTKFKEVTNA